LSLSHGLVEKVYNTYEEPIHIPLIVSNPKLHVCSQETHSLIGVLNIVPPMADLLGVSSAFESCVLWNQFGGSIA
jgi:arylsulfatase A-like enzyme